MDFDLHHLEQAQKLVAGRLQESRVLRRLDSPARQCASTRGFLKSVEGLIDHSLAAAATPSSRCYVYNARNYTLTLTKWTRVRSEQVQLKRKDGTTLKSSCSNLVRAEFSVLNHKSERSNFELLVGTDGELRGVPVRILYRPNFWFEVELNLDNAAGSQSNTSTRLP